jgi:hypothetical protein
MALDKNNITPKAHASDDTKRTARRPYEVPTLHSARSALLDLACVSCGTAQSPDCPACDTVQTP